MAKVTGRIEYVGNFDWGCGAIANVRGVTVRVAANLEVTKATALHLYDEVEFEGRWNHTGGFEADTVTHVSSVSRE